MASLFRSITGIAAVFALHGWGCGFQPPHLFASRLLGLGLTPVMAAARSTHLDPRLPPHVRGQGQRHPNVAAHRHRNWRIPLLRETFTPFELPGATLTLFATWRGTLAP